MTKSTPAYLAAKRTVDDRALNRRVLERFGSELEATARERRGESERRQVRIVELGAGVGTMVARLASRRLLPERASYRVIDRDPECVAFARDRLPRWLGEAGYDVREAGDGLVARSEGRRLEVSLEVADAFAVSDDTDAVVAAAFLDLVDLERAVRKMADLAGDGGLAYAPITYDGGTSFSPAHPADGRVERSYHRHMDEVREAGSSRTGRELLSFLSSSEHETLAAGGSDWVVRPRGGEYPARERRFVSHVLETVGGALEEVPDGRLDPADRDAWLRRRRGELERTELVYVSHNLDVLARTGSSH